MADNTAAKQADAEKILAEAQAMYEETKKMLEEMKSQQSVGSSEPEEDPETVAILVGIKANEERMKEKVPLRVDIDSLNRSNRYLFAGIGTDAVKIKRGSTVTVPRSLHDAVAASIEQHEKAEALMDSRSEEWDPDAWKNGLI